MTPHPFNPDHIYGELATVTDPAYWREAATELAAQTVPTGYKVLIAFNGTDGIAWFYPVDRWPSHLYYWEREEIVISAPNPELVTTKKFWELMQHSAFYRVSRHEGVIGHQRYTVVTAPEDVPGFYEDIVEDVLHKLGYPKSKKRGFFEQLRGWIGNYGP